MDDDRSECNRKGASFGDQTAQSEYGLARAEIIEALVAAKHGDRHLKERQAMTGLSKIDRELKDLRVRMAVLEDRKSERMAGLRP